MYQQTAILRPGSMHPKFEAYWRALLIGGALLIGISGRILYGNGAPFWFDETFSGVIASQPTFGRLLDWCLNELTGPAYYMPLWLWAKVAGTGDAALRLPSLLLSIATPLLILWRGSRNRDLRLFWAGVVPALGTGVRHGRRSARLCAAVLAWDGAGDPFRAADRTPHNRTRDRVGGGVRTVAAHALLERGAMRRTGHLLPGGSPTSRGGDLAGGAAAGAGGRLGSAFHLPIVLTLTGGGTATGAYRASVLADLPGALFGLWVVAAIIFATVVASLFRYCRGWGLRSTSAEAALAYCGLAGVVVVTLVACLRPGFAPRYLTPAMPSLLFAFAVMGALDAGAR